jgi:hypothetical protein
MSYTPYIQYKPISGNTLNINTTTIYNGVNVLETIPVLVNGTNSNALIPAIEPYVGVSVNRYISGVLNNAASPTVPTDAMG